MSRTISAEALDALRANSAGQTVTPDDERYAQARKTWYCAIERRPALRATCAGATDEAAAAPFARDTDLPATVRSGGHAVAGYSAADVAVLIDLPAMTG